MVLHLVPAPQCLMLDIDAFKYTQAIQETPDKPELQRHIKKKQRSHKKQRTKQHKIKVFEAFML